MVYIPLSSGLVLVGVAFFLCVLFVALVHALILRAGMRTAVVFRHIGLVVQQNIPLSMGLYYAALSETGAARRILSRTSRLVETGVPLSQALNTAFPNFPAVTLSIIRAAEQTGTLPSALRELNRRLARRAIERQGSASCRGAVLAFEALVFLLMYEGYRYLVVPRFQMIFADADLPLSLFAREVFSAFLFSDMAPTTVWGRLYALAILGVVLIPPALLVWHFIRMRPRRADRCGILTILVDYWRWRLWPWRRLVVAEGCAQALPVLRLAVAAGWPLPVAAERASEVETNYFWQRRLREWAAGMRGGADPVSAGQRVGLPELLLRHLAIGRRDGAMDAALYHAEDYYAALTHRRHQLLFHLLWPVGTLFMGVLIGVFCVAVFLSLGMLVEGILRTMG